MRRPGMLVCGLICLLLANVARGRGRASFTSPLPGPTEFVFGNDRFQDLAFLSGGFRRMAANAAWIQYLQFIGDEELGRGGYATKEDLESGVAFPGLLKRTLRVTRLDPWFHQAYLYGASIFAWSPAKKEPQKAVALLQEAIRYNPDYWMYHTFLAAIAYKEKGSFESMAATLEKALQHPDCPLLVKSILANQYKRLGRKADALKLWLDILEDDNSAQYRQRAMQQIEELRTDLKLK